MLSFLDFSNQPSWRYLFCGIGSWLMNPITTQNHYSVLKRLHDPKEGLRPREGAERWHRRINPSVVFHFSLPDEFSIFHKICSKTKAFFCSEINSKCPPLPPEQPVGRSRNRGQLAPARSCSWRSACYALLCTRNDILFISVKGDAISKRITESTITTALLHIRLTKHGRLASRYHEHAVARQQPA